MQDKLKKEEANRVLGLEKIRAGRDKYEKGILILLEEPLGKKFTINSICSCLKLDFKYFKNRLWGYFLGYSPQEHSKKYYLNKQQEKELYEIIVEHEKNLNCLTVSEVKSKVEYY